MSRIFLLIYAAAAALFTSNFGALAQLGLQNALLSSLDRDVTPPPFPTVNVHLDEAPPSDEKETDLARVIRDDNAAQRRMRDAFVARRRAFQALMSDQQESVQFLRDLGEASKNLV
ncbi:putative transmembrane protein [Toxoplasma gondii TgCatPRC2]|uniref:Uncharacterized protein n=13 Tax=Toxoplasma gondii TaxID=5811 RepID=A0A125YJY2_TOXGG|nr:hypothetical protein TGGT1_233780 [Toxoplasma gondii GT1]ESS36089.1 putative transmembrane protein [Toxoplasma gondii VEG]KAF4641952.1 hypothetical protein TGRH88_077640 [Toxoplasma gondii]KFG48948.1 putative transmembrane protein [Toxoplasma gondii GAB2-2007-GAL-DOM2]KFG49874.1 putative transmembrane protein [Toxoplasma gondii FOU]KFG51413.1 putative transmembrane protein [Toxoplasma gondii p89]KFG63924.1 putative transmembrane protein [Toxoplasma gondii RUB]KFH11457.1 putative transmemb